MDIEGAPQLYGLRHKDYARSHKIAAARILARLGLEEGKRYLRRTYVQTPFRRVHPEEEDGPKRDMAASTAQLYRMVKKETNDGADIIIPLRGHNERLLPRVQAPPAHGRGQRTHPPDRVRLRRRTYFASTHPHRIHSRTRRRGPQISAHQSNHINHSSDDGSSESAEPNSDSQPTNPVNPTHPINPASDKITAHHQNHRNHSSDHIPEWIQDFANPYTQYAIRNCAEEAESIYHSIIPALSRPTRPRLRQTQSRRAHGRIQPIHGRTRP